MRILIIILTVLGHAFPLSAWELLLTKDGTEIEGDVTQPEFLFRDQSGGEFVIPRAAVESFEAAEEGLIKAVLKDGTNVVGLLEGKLEIGDGLIRRRYAGSDIKHVYFDQFIVIRREEKYHSCPIRIELDASVILFGESSVASTALPSLVECEGFRIGHIAFSRKGRVKAGKDISIDANVALDAPDGEDQLVNLSIQLLQGATVIAKGKSKFTVASGKVSVVPLAIRFPGQKLDVGGPEARFHVQVVSQDASREVERGGVFWWFTIPLGL